MPYRSPKKRAEAKEHARKLYVEFGLSLDEIHQQTGETPRTLRSWCKRGDWEDLREAETKTELGRLKDLRSSMLDRAEDQMKADKLPHTEIGLISKLERLIGQREEIGDMEARIATNTIMCLVEYLREHDKELGQALSDHILPFGKWLFKQDSLPVPRDPALMKKVTKYDMAKFARGETRGLPQGSLLDAYL